VFAGLGSGVNVWEPMGGIPLIESCIQNGTVQWLYDANPGRGLTIAAGRLVTWAPAAGAGLTASDVLVPLGAAPLAPIAFWGREAVWTLGAEAAQSATPATAKLVATPCDIVVVARSVPIATYQYIYDGAVAAQRCIFGPEGVTNYELYNGAWWNTAIPVVALEYAMFANHHDNAGASTFRRRTSAGAVTLAGPAASGALGMQGLTLFSSYGTGRNATCAITAIMCVTGLTAADQARLDAWCRLAMRWT